jgi:hypothetical protein
MFGIESLDVMIGIVTIYLIFALACTAIVEAVSTWLNVRSTNLEAALGEFLHGSVEDDKAFTDAFFAHPIVQSLSKGRDGRPSYIPPEIVGQVVTGLVYAKEGASTLKQAIADLPGTSEDNRIKGLLDALHREAGEDIAAFRKLVEYHYDAAMDRASGWYKKKTQTIALVVSAFLVIGANVDTLKIANALSTNPEARTKMAELAQEQVNLINETAQTASSTPAAPTLKEATEKLAKANADLTSAGIQLGWKGFYPKLQKDEAKNEWLLETWLFQWGELIFSTAGISKFFGLLISILAISLGAPFWFDILNRVMQVRAAGASPREKKTQ